MSSWVRRALAPIASAALLGGLLLSAPSAIAAGSQTYLVVYKSLAVPNGAAAAVERAGGSMVAQYDAIGVAVARSSSSTFRSTILADGRVTGAAVTSKVVTRILDGASDNSAAPTPNIPATDSDNLSGLQWDMRQIHTPEAHAITGGSPSVLVGDLDTGLDFNHPDLAPNYDAANSTDCSSGVASPLLDGNDQQGHGTHTAGTIAAAANGVGIVGVAPNVRIAGVKTSNDAGFFFPEMVVCAFMWAGSHHFDVTNNSYFADPWLFNCKNDPEQRAIFKAESRAIRYALNQGTVVVAAEGNFSDDLAHPTQDVISPDTDAAPPPRDITNACEIVPVEVPGVIGVTANGNLGIKSFYSNYGVGVTQVVAPGGDSRLQRTAAAPNGRVLSTWPSYLASSCLRKVMDGAALYCYLQGTSMASPHVTGVAALIRSISPGITARAMIARVDKTADPMACPDIAPYAPYPSMSNGAPQRCTGGTGYNSFNGHGQVNALTAVSP